MKKRNSAAKQFGLVIVSVGIMAAAMPAHAAPAKEKLRIGEVSNVDYQFGPYKALVMYRVGNLLYVETGMAAGRGFKDTGTWIEPWPAAQKVCSGNTIDGVQGWRLPTGAELEAWLRDPDPAKEAHYKDYFTNNPYEFGMLKTSSTETVFELRTQQERSMDQSVCVHELYGPYKTGKGAATARNEKKAPDSKPLSGAVLTATKQPQSQPLPQASAEQKGPPTTPLAKPKPSQKHTVTMPYFFDARAATEAEARAKVEAERASWDKGGTHRIASEKPVKCITERAGLVSCRKELTYSFEADFDPNAKKAKTGPSRTVTK